MRSIHLLRARVLHPDRMGTRSSEQFSSYSSHNKSKKLKRYLSFIGVSNASLDFESLVLYLRAWRIWDSTNHSMGCLPVLGLNRKLTCFCTCVLHPVCLLRWRACLQNWFCFWETCSSELDRVDPDENEEIRQKSKQVPPQDVQVWSSELFGCVPTCYKTQIWFWICFRNWS